MQLASAKNEAHSISLRLASGSVVISIAGPADASSITLRPMAFVGLMRAAIDKMTESLLKRS